ncbi:MAG: uroporphyrinogen decarboxylase family protein [Acidobacteriota bacterium]
MKKTTKTGRQFLLQALHHCDLVRIPVAPFIHVNYVKEFFNDHDVDFVAATIDVYRHFGFDLIHRNCSVVYDHFAAVETPDWRVSVETERFGRDERTVTQVRTPEGVMRRVSELRWTCEYDCEVSSIEFPIKSPKDLELCRKYMPPVGHLDVTPIRRARRLVGEEGVIAPWVQGAFNELALSYRNLESLLIDALVDPEFYTDLMNFSLQRLFPVLRLQIEAGADLLSTGGNVANGKLISPGFFRQHIAPFEKQVVDFVQRQGVIVLYHNCGYASRIVPQYPDVGMKAYESLTPPPYGDTVLPGALACFDPGCTTLLGNIDQITLLRKGSPEEIDAAVEQTLCEVKKWSGGKSFLLGTTDYFNENTPETNIRALAEAGRKHGQI